MFNGCPHTNLWPPDEATLEEAVPEEAPEGARVAANFDTESFLMQPIPREQSTPQHKSCYMRDSVEFDIPCNLRIQHSLFDLLMC